LKVGIHRLINHKVTCLKNKVFIVLLLAMGFSACKQGNKVVPTKTFDVYVAGFIRAANGNAVAAYWKNGSLVTLANPSIRSEAVAIAVYRNDVYAAGNVTTLNGNFVAAYWKNGVITKLGDSTSSIGASAIAVNSDGVYVTGSGTDGAVYWKNGAMVHLTGSDLSKTSGIALNGNDVYIAGMSANPSGYIATYWKNGVETALTPGPGISIAGGIAVSGNDVYIAGTLIGFLQNTAVYWKNGVQVNLTDKVTTASAAGVAVDGGNVYVAGQAELLVNASASPGQNSMYYWKNGTLANPQSASAATTNMSIGGIAVAGPDVYVAGNFGGFPAYWKNGTLVQMTGSQGTAHAIAVAER
jgi:hypothetical protein